METKDDEVSVGFEVTGDARFKINYNSPLLQNHILDYPSIPEDERPGQMRRLLCGSVVGCLSATIYFMLTSRGGQIKSMNSTGTTTTVRAAGSPSAVKAIDIRVEIDIDDKDAALLDKVKKIAQRGCPDFKTHRAIHRGYPYHCKNWNRVIEGLHRSG